MFHVEPGAGSTGLGLYLFIPNLEGRPRNLSGDLKGGFVHFLGATARSSASAASARRPQRRAGESEKPARRALGKPSRRGALPLRTQPACGLRKFKPVSCRTEIRRRSARPKTPQKCRYCIRQQEDLHPDSLVPTC